VYLEFVFSFFSSAEFALDVQTFTNRQYETALGWSATIKCFLCALHEQVIP